MSTLKSLLALAILVGSWWGGAQAAEAACATTRVYLLLDTSGSMKGTKHSDVRTAIKNLTSTYKNVLEFGLGTFGSSYQHRVGISATGWQTINSSVDSYPSNENYTRMATSIKAAGQYIQGLKQNEPAATKNRPYYLVLITDGYPTGESGDPAKETETLWKTYGIKTFVIGIQFNATLLNDIAKEGQTQQAYSATNQSTLNSAFSSIANRASAEVCDGLDNDCDGQVDEGLSRTCSNACGSGTQQCSNAQWTTCSSSQNARPEVCDGKDNDCDGKTDEDWPDLGKSCSVGQGVCKRTSTYRCKANGSGIECPVQPGSPTGPETCNGKDDDCDGKVDGITRNCSTACGSGTQFCLIAFWLSCSAPSPKAEECNNQDDDCDGQVDEDWSLKGKSCTASGSGSCASVGVWKCNASGSGLTCAGASPNGKPEVCNGLDDDCDGNIDEDWPNKGKPCGSGTGGCQQNGKYVCKPDGSGLQCSSSGGTPKPETCDGLDNDCDGQTDENLTRPCRSNCGQGTETCLSGQWGYCDAPTPQTEVCDTKDNDCNGKVDDVAPKDCQAKCGKGQSVCENGVWAECKGPPPSEEKCDGQDNDCDGTVDEDLERECTSKCGTGKETCSQGKWGNCDAPKPSLDICDGKDNDCDGQTDNGARCPPGAECKFGRCFLKCRNGECPSGSFCEGDLCNGDLCDKVNCSDGQSCVVGRCVDKCELGTCPSGLACRKGVCYDPNNPGETPNTPDGNNGSENNGNHGENNGNNGENGGQTDGGGTTPDTPGNGVADIPTIGDSTTGGNNNPPTGNGRGRPTGCLCSGSQPDNQGAPWTLFLSIFLIFGWLRFQQRR